MQKKLFVLVVSMSFLILISSSTRNNILANNNNPPPVKPGIDVLIDKQFSLIKGKNLGLITNPTGIARQFKSTIDALNDIPGVKLVALFGPEHGVRGDIPGGERIATYKDKKTGISVYSLYGETYKPT
ncbi:DUF1343 domain-containing protein, partial [candidate division KSB1 bacterium]|nr:DUF1343 domain-containing protein [candidate division KSB1 bacterium]